MNKVIISGRTTADIELKATQTGKSVATFTVAVDTGYGENKQTAFLDVIAWEKMAELVSQYVHKGNKVLICGRLQTRNWEDKDGKKRKATEIVANEIEFIEAKKDGATPAAEPREAKPNWKEEAEKYIENDEDLPF